MKQGEAAMSTPLRSLLVACVLLAPGAAVKGVAPGDLARPRLVAQTGLGDSLPDCTAMSPDGRLLATAEYRILKLWDLPSGLEIRSFDGLDQVPTSLTFDPTGQYLAAGIRGTALVWSVNSGVLLRRFHAQDEAPPVNFSADGKLLVVGDEFQPGTAVGIMICDVSNGKYYPVPTAGRVQTAAFSPDGKRVATWGDKSGLSVWDLDTRKPIWSHAFENVKTLAFTPDGKSLSVLTNSNDNKGVVSRNASTGAPSSPPQQDPSWETVALSPDGLSFAVLEKQGALSVRGVTDGQHSKGITTIMVGGAYQLTLGKKAVVLWGGNGRRIRVWDVSNRLELQGPRPGRTMRFRDVSFDPMGEDLAFIGEPHGDICLWDLRSNRFAYPVGQGFAKFSPDGRWLIAGSIEGMPGPGLLYLSDRTAGTLMARVPGTSAPVAFDPTSHVFACVSDDGKVQLRSTDRGQLIRVIDGDYARPIDLAFTPDGKSLVGVGGHSIYTWLLANGELTSTHANPGDWSRPTAFSSDVRHLIAGSGPIYRAGAAMSVFEVSSAKQEIDLKSWSGLVGTPGFRPGEPDLASSVVLGAADTFTRFDPFGQYWLTGTPDGATTLWRGSWKEPRRLATIVLFGGLKGGQDWAVMGPDGRYDGSRNGDTPGLHWVLGNQPRDLGEFKSQYYSPGLLAELLGVFQDIPEAPENDPAEVEAAKAVEGLGGHVTRDRTRAGNPVVAVSFSGDTVTDADLKSLATFKNLRMVYIATTTRITGAGFAELKDLRNLRFLYASSSGVNDDGLKGIGQLKNLQTLYLGGAKVTDAGLADLAGLANLQMLTLSYDKITSAGAGALGRLKGLRRLHLIATEMTDDGLKEFKGLSNLDYLEVWDTKVTAPGVQGLRLSLPNCRIEK
jgi:WD40 repeat protein